MAIRPFDTVEQDHLSDAIEWLESGAPLFRIGKPDQPAKHLVSYFAVVDEGHILLVDHKNAQRWLPTGGHVEANENPRETVVRELKEELGMEISLAQVGAPCMIPVTQTVGLTSGHTDVSLWYVVRAGRSSKIDFDAAEFNDVRWFSFSEAAAVRSDPNLVRFLAKLSAVDAPPHQLT
jgi:8-oxo-dGTP pyrophosphatase MutT (NUDIX family)